MEGVYFYNPGAHTGQRILIKCSDAIGADKHSWMLLSHATLTFTFGPKINAIFGFFSATMRTKMGDL